MTEEYDIKLIKEVYTLKFQFRMNRPIIKRFRFYWVKKTYEWDWISDEFFLSDKGWVLKEEREVPFKWEYFRKFVKETVVVNNSVKYGRE